MIMHSNLLVTGNQKGGDKNDLWKIHFPIADELIENNNEIYNLWHNDNNKDDWNNNIPIPPVEIKTMDDKEILQQVNHLVLSAYNQKNAKISMEFLHARAGYLVIETWIKAINKGFICHDRSLINSKDHNG